MSGLEALSLVCNIMTIITFARDTIVICKAAYNGDALDSDLSANISLMLDISSEVQSHHLATQPHTQTERKLADVAKKCQDAAKALEDEINFISSHQKKGSWAATIKAAAKTKWRARRLEKLNKTMNDCKSTMETALLARVCTTAEAVKLQQSQGFQDLGDQMKSFIVQYAAGKKRTEDLIIKEFAATKRHTEQEIIRAETSINTHVDARITLAQDLITSHTSTGMNKATANITSYVQNIRNSEITDKRREALLGSLKFTAMNERRNQIPDVFEGSFAKIFNMDASLNVSPRNTESSISGSSHHVGQENDGYDSDLFRHHDSLVSWMESDCSLFWVTGKPGSGKSTLAKFLLTSPRTRAALQAWDPEFQIISHFFWKLGTSMQSNRKGFLCSLLYQLLDLDKTIIDQTINKYAWIAPKDSVTDWSITELQKVLFEVLSMHCRSIYIFIDGVDEVCTEDDPSLILKLIDELRKHQRVKVCVFSRPEPCFRLHFAALPHLAIHELNSRDMREYAQAYLAPYWRTPYAEDNISQYFLIEKLIDKSEGVFLWLCLALRSLKEGLQNGDSGEELKERLEHLPSDLSKLFLDMWQRTNGENTIYRKKAAQYFNLVIHKQGLGSTWTEGLPLCRVTAITEPSFEEVFVIKDPSSRNQKMKYLCHKTSELVRFKTAGILEVVSSDVPRCQSTTCIFGCVCGMSEISQVIKFIHRTAYDFLVGTEDGLYIRHWDYSSKEESLLQLAKGVFTELRSWPVDDGEEIIKEGLNILSHIKSDELRPKVHNLLDQSLVSYDGWSSSIYPEFGFHFLTHLTSYPQHFDYISTSIRQSPDPPSLATRILGEIFVLWPTCHRRPGIRNLHLALPLLRLGADPNVLFSALPSQPGFLPQATAFESYLKIAISCMHLKHGTVPCMNEGIEIAKLLGPSLRQFLESNPDMDAKTLLGIPLSESYHYNPCPLIPRVQTLPDPDLTTPYASHRILELKVNMRLLMEVFLRLALSDYQLVSKPEAAWTRSDLVWAQSYVMSLPSHGPEATMLYWTRREPTNPYRILSGQLVEPVDSTILLIEESWSTDDFEDNDSVVKRYETKIASMSKGFKIESSRERLWSEMADNGLGIYIPKKG